MPSMVIQLIAIQILSLLRYSYQSDLINNFLVLSFLFPFFPQAFIGTINFLCNTSDNHHVFKAFYSKGDVDRAYQHSRDLNEDIKNLIEFLKEVALKMYT